MKSTDLRYTSKVTVPGKKDRYFLSDTNAQEAYNQLRAAGVDAQWEKGDWDFSVTRVNP